MAHTENEKKGKIGAPRGNRNAAKVGEDLRLELYLSKTRRAFLEEWYELRFGYKPSARTANLLCKEVGGVV